MRKAPGASGLDQSSDELRSPGVLYRDAHLALQRRPEAEEPGRPGTASAYDSIIAMANRSNVRPGAQTPNLTAGGGLHEQARLEVNRPEDEYEHEADQVAETVMRMPAPALEEKEEAEEDEEMAVEPTASSPGVQRMCEECETGAAAEECEECSEELEPTTSAGHEIQAQPAPGGVLAPSPQASAAIHELEGRGQPLPASERAFFEPRFGTDFGQVRVHADDRGDRAAQSIKARAFTLGSDVVFRAGEYGPGSRAGRTLLAHELTHVIQQRGGGPASSGQPPTTTGTLRASRAGMIQKEPEPAADSRSSLELPPGHHDRMATLHDLGSGLANMRERRAGDIAAREAIPKQTPADLEEAEQRRQALERAQQQIEVVEDEMIQTLDSKIAIIDESIAEIDAVLPGQSGPDIPESGDVLRESARLQAEREQAELEKWRLPLQRRRGREEIRELERQLATLPLSPEGRAELEARKRELGEHLSGAAEQRDPPGTSKKSSIGCAVAYQHEVKVGGSLGWRFNNPGNVGPFPSVPEWPPGALAVAPAGDKCGSPKIGMFIFADMVHGHAEVARRGDDAVKKGRYIAEFLLDYSHEGKRYLDSIRQDCPNAGVGTEDNGGKNGARMSPAVRDCILNAIRHWESNAGTANACDPYTCGKSDGPPDVRAMLGCDE